MSALHPGDTLVVTTLDRLGRSTANMLTLADDLRARGASLRVLNPGVVIHIDGLDNRFLDTQQRSPYP